MPPKTTVSRGSLRTTAFPTRAGLKSLYARLLQRSNVVGCFVGRKRVNNRLRRQLAVVCCVTEKRSYGSLSKSARVPKQIEWLRTRRRVATVRTDVQVAGPSKFCATVIGPGDEMTAPARATLGFVLQHPEYGRVVTTAGHAFIPKGYGQITYAPPRPVSLLNMPSPAASAAVAGQVLKAVVRRETDYALIAPVGPCGNLYEDFYTLAGLHWARPDDVNQPLFALTTSGLQKTTLRGIEGTVEIEGIQMDGLLLTDNIAAPGDSGAALVDADFTLWGLLVGYVTIHERRMSVFAPADWVLTFEKAELA